MAAMGVEKLQAVWNRLGADDPLWAVLSDPAMKGGRWELDEFMLTGADHVQRYLVDRVRRHGLSLGDRVLDFGCGVGRLSQALASHATRVVGIDIAASMIDLAKRINAHPDSVDFIHFDGRRFPFADNSFDSAVSLMVVQHSPPEVQLRSLLELQRVVRPGGVVVVQIPSEPRPGEPIRPEACRASIAVLEAAEIIPAGSTAQLRLRLTNRGTACWPAEAVKLGNHWYRAGDMIVQDDGRTALPRELAAGDSIELALLVRAPDAPGHYEIEFDIVQEFVSWWADLGSETTRIPVVVSGDGASADLVATSPDMAPILVDEPEGFQMHPLPLELVSGLFAHCGSEIISAEQDDLAGSDWCSHTHVIRIGEG